MKKGVIAAPAKVSGDGSTLNINDSLTHGDIRYFLMYWDKIVIPTTNLIHIEIPEEDYLLVSGILERPRLEISGINFNGEMAARSQLLSQTLAAQNLIDNDKETDWVFHQSGGEEILIHENSKSFQTNAIKVQLGNLLPAPKPDTPLVDILDFKERRADELGNLHHTLNDLYVEIRSSVDADVAQSSATARLKEAIADINKSAFERFKSSCKVDFTAEISINGSDLWPALATGALVDHFIPVYSAPLATITGAALSAIKISYKITRTVSTKKEKIVLGYLAKAHKEGIVHR